MIKFKGATNRVTQFLRPKINSLNIVYILSISVLIFFILSTVIITDINMWSVCCALLVTYYYDDDDDDDDDYDYDYYYYKCHGLIIALPSHSCRATLHKLHLNSSMQTSADCQSGQHQVSRMTDEKAETWSPFGMSEVRSRPESLVADCSMPTLQPPERRGRQG